MRKRLYHQVREARKKEEGLKRGRTAQPLVTEQELAEESIIKGLLVGIAIVGVLMLYFTSVKTAEAGFSQLYLNEMQEKGAFVGQPYDFSFTIENRERRDAAYEYAVLLDGRKMNGQKLILSPDETFTVASRLAPLAYGTHRVEVSVHVDGKAEPLSVWFNLQAR